MDILSYMRGKNAGGGGGGGLPDPTADGVALIGVNGEWKQQSGYGYSESLTIEWNGDTTGRETLPAEFGFGNNYKVSDNCPNIPDKIVVTVLYSDQEFVDEYAPIELEEGLPMWCVSGASGMMVIGVSEDFDVEGIAFHKGIYFLKYEESGISGLTTKAIFPASVHTIDPKFIPMSDIQSMIDEAIGGAVDDSY